MAPVPAYVYKATLDRMVDADTYWLVLDFGLLSGARITLPVYIRLHGFERVAGQPVRPGRGVRVRRHPTAEHDHGGPDYDRGPDDPGPHGDRAAEHTADHHRTEHQGQAALPLRQ